MNALIEKLREHCLGKPGVQKRCDYEEAYAVLSGSLDGFATFESEKTPAELLLRCHDSTRKRLQKTSPGVRISERMKWDTKGWKWTDVPLDGSVPEETLCSLIDDSYQIVCDSFDDYRALYLAQVIRNPSAPDLLAELISHFNLTRHHDEIQNLIRPALLLKTGPADESQMALGQTKIGGQPDLPKGTTWPTFRGGKPFAFLLQINLAEIPKAIRFADLPEDGILSFFSVYGWQEDGDADPHLPPGEYEYDWTQILYHPASAGPLRRHPTPPAVNAFKAAAVEFVPILSLPTDIKEPDVAKLKWKKDIKERFDDLVMSFNDIRGHQNGNPAPNVLGGFAEYIQMFVDAVAEQDLQLLFQLASDDHAGMCWGDGGYIYFWIRPDDLKRRVFTRVYTDYQCG
jgi:uncharacterized protein YwqG/predicted DNA-binding protein (MmcQ/YjbR family)